MTTRHVHEWTLVQIGNEPVGATCECGESRGLADPGDRPTPMLEAGTLVRIGEATMAVESVNMNFMINQPTTADVVLIDSSYWMADRAVDPERLEFEKFYELGSYQPITVVNGRLDPRGNPRV